MSVEQWYLTTRFTRVDALGGPPERFVLLFLAHNGVHNASVWEYWKSFAPPSIVTFCVHAPPVVPVGQSFCDQYRLDSQWEPSGWCQPSIVRETVKALDATCALFKGKVVINLVSGTDIPVKPYTFLFSNRLYESVLPSHQWFSLTIDDARLVVARLKHNEWYGLTDLIKKDERGCPDEYVIQRAARALRIFYNTTKFYTIDWRDKEVGAESPAEWKSMHDVKDVMPMCLYGVTFETLLETLRCTWSTEDGGMYPLFLRKVLFEMNLDAPELKMMYDPSVPLKTVPSRSLPLFKKEYNCRPWMLNYSSVKAIESNRAIDAFFEANTDAQKVHDSLVENKFNF